MFSTSSVNVIGFDPNRVSWPVNGCALFIFCEENISRDFRWLGNTDQARAYASKYCSKPEKWCDFNIASVDLEFVC